jgi:hypothetical protein
MEWTIILCAGVTLTQSPQEIFSLVPHGLVLDLGSGVEILLEFVPEKLNAYLHDQLIVSMLTLKYQYRCWLKVSQSLLHSDFRFIVHFLMDIFGEISEGKYPAHQLVNVYNIRHNTDLTVDVLFHELDLKRISKKIG